MVRKPLLIVALVLALVLGGTAAAYAGLETTPMYRFYNVRNGSHFFTSDAGERDTIIATLGNTYQYEGVAYSIVAPGQLSAYLAERIATLQTQIDALVTRVTAAEGDVDALTTRVQDLEAAAPAPAGATYRWAVFSTYDTVSGWYGNNDATMFGGVAPSAWGDGLGRASQMSADKSVLRALFSNKGYVGANAMVWSEEWMAYSSTNSRHAAVLFRVRNSTDAAIDWNVNAYMTGYGSWGEARTIALNGTDVMNSTGSYPPANCEVTRTISIPPNRTSTVIFVAGSGPYQSTSGYMYQRSLMLGFYNNCLDLPDGLEFVDDLDTATGGWEQ